MGLALRILSVIKDSVLLQSFIVIAFAMSLSSCTVISKKIDSERDLQGDSFKVDSTHVSEVIDDIGPPSKLSRYGDGLVFLYESIEKRERQIGLSSDYNILRLLKFSYARGIADREILLLIFDREGYLWAKGHKTFQENLGSGQAIDFLFSIQSLVDSSSLEQDPPALSWGSSLLTPLPESLNYSHNVTSGDSGIEQLGVPKGVGQSTLEMAE